MDRPVVASALPKLIPWPERLPYEVAMVPESADTIAFSYAQSGQIQWADWLVWKTMPVFTTAVENAKEKLLESGSSAQIKAQMLLEASLPAMFDVVQSPMIDPEARVKAFAQLKEVAGAGYAAKKQEPVASANSGMQVTFNLGGGNGGQKRVVETIIIPPKAASTDLDLDQYMFEFDPEEE